VGVAENPIHLVGQNALKVTGLGLALEPLEGRALVVGAGIAVIDIDLIDRPAVPGGKLLAQPLLFGQGVALAGLFIGGDAQINGHGDILLAVAVGLDQPFKTGVLPVEVIQPEGVIQGDGAIGVRHRQAPFPSKCGG